MTSAPFQSSRDSLQTWRLQALNWILRGQFIFWLLVYLASTWNAIQNYQEKAQTVSGALGVFVTSITLYTVIFALFALITFVQELGYRPRVFLMLGAYYFLSLALFGLSALSGDARLFLYAFVILAAIFLDAPWNLLALAAALLNFAVMGWLNVTGIMTIATELQYNASNPSSWITGGIVFAALSISLSLGITLLLRSLRQSLEKADTALQNEQRASASLRLLSSVNQLIVREHEPNHLLEKTCQFIFDNGYDYVWISLLQPDGISLSPEKCAGNTSHPPIPECALQAIHARARIVTPPNLAIPILRPSRNLGVLVINSSASFTDSEVALFQELADDLAYALENIETETQRRAIAETAAPLLTASDESEFWSAALQAVQAILRGDRAAVYIYEYGTDRLTCPYSAGLSQEYIDEINRRFREVPGARLFRDPQPVPVNDTESDPLAAPLRPFLQREGIRSYCVFPLFSAQKLLGAFVAYRSAVIPFSQSDLEAGQTLAHLVAASLQNARLFAETRAKANEQAALFIAAQEMSASLLNPPALLETLARQLVSTLNATSAYISSFDASLETLTLRAEYWSESALPAERKSDLGRQYPASGFPNVVQILNSNRGVVVHQDEPNMSEAERREYQEYGVKSKLFVPLLSHGRLVGHAEIWESRRKREFTQHEMDLAQALSSHAASVIHATNLFAELEKREAHFRALIEHSAEGVAILDADGNFRYVAPAEERLTGYPPQELIGKSAFANIHPEDAPRLLQAFQAGVQQPDSVTTLSYRLRRADGEWRHYEVTGHNLLHDPFIKGVVINYRDITERKLAEREARESAKRYLALFTMLRLMTDTMPDLLWAKDLDGRYIFANRAICEKLLNASDTDEPLGKTDLFFAERERQSHPEDPNWHTFGEICVNSDAVVLENEQAQRFDEFGNVKGEFLFLDVHKAPLYDESGKLIGTVGSGRIVTEEKAAQAKIQQQAEELAQAYDSTLEGWARALELRDKDTEGHTRRVTELALSLARAMNVPEEQLVHMRRGGILHDIGKMAVSDEILHKPAPLSVEESEIMRQHPRYAYEMLSHIEYLQPALDIPYCHHEHWDGSGYPRGLKGEEIPLAARIFAVVDVYDALTSDRPYRSAWKIEDALKYIIENAGKYFDPKIVTAFLSLMKQEE